MTSFLSLENGSFRLKKIKEHPKEHISKLKIDEITDSNPQSGTQYDNGKNKPLVYP